MRMTIENGANGNTAIVDKKGRVHALAISQSAQESAAADGESFNINTGTLAFTNDAEAGVLYFKNNGDDELVIVTIGILPGASTGATGDMQVTVLRNPSTGTVVSDQDDVAININKNFGNSGTLVVDAYKGGQGKTITDGVDAYYSLLKNTQGPYAINTGGIHLPKGASMGIKFTPPVGNTTMNVQFFMAVVKAIDVSQ